MVILNDELIAFGCDDNSIKIYDRNNGILVRTLPINAKIKTLAVLKDENLIYAERLKRAGFSIILLDFFIFGFIGP
jgi:hypothetical protein